MIFNDQNHTAFTQESSLHKFRTEIPNIIFFMDLDPYEFKGYSVFKWTAGDNGISFKSNSTLCKEIGCANPKLIQIKKALQRKDLIKITKQQDQYGGTLPDLVTIVDIWSKNMQEIPRILEEKKQGGGNRRLGGGVIQNKGGGNRRLPKQEPIEEDLKTNKQEGVVVSFFISEEEKKRSILKKYELTDCFLVKIFPFPLEQIRLACEAYDQYSQGKTLENPMGCLWKAIKLAWIPNIEKQDSEKAKSKKAAKMEILIATNRMRVRDLIDKYRDSFSRDYSFFLREDRVELFYPTGITPLPLNEKECIDMLEWYIQTNLK